MSDTNSKN